MKKRFMAILLACSLVAGMFSMDTVSYASEVTTEAVSEEVTENDVIGDNQEKVPDLVKESIGDVEKESDLEAQTSDSQGLLASEQQAKVYKIWVKDEDDYGNVIATELSVSSVEGKQLLAYYIEDGTYNLDDLSFNNKERLWLNNAKLTCSESNMVQLLDCCISREDDTRTYEERCRLIGRSEIKSDICTIKSDTENSFKLHADTKYENFDGYLANEVVTEMVSGNAVEFHFDHDYTLNSSIYTTGKVFVDNGTLSIKSEDDRCGFSRVGDFEIGENGSVNCKWEDAEGYFVYNTITCTNSLVINNLDKKNVNARFIIEKTATVSGQEIYYSKETPNLTLDGKQKEEYVILYDETLGRWRALDYKDVFFICQPQNDSGNYGTVKIYGQKGTYEEPDIAGNLYGWGKQAKFKFEPQRGYELNKNTGVSVQKIGWTEDGESVTEGSPIVLTYDETEDAYLFSFPEDMKEDSYDYVEYDLIYEFIKSDEKKVSSINIKKADSGALPIAFTKLSDSVQLTADVLPEDAACKDIVWCSADETVAKVDASGKVIPVGNGKTTIIATAKDGSGVKDTCAVTVDIGIAEDEKKDIKKENDSAGSVIAEKKIDTTVKNYITVSGFTVNNTENVLDNQEKNDIRDGKDATISLYVTDIENTLSETEKNKIAAVTKTLSSDVKPVVTLDLSVFKAVDDQVDRITELQNKITVSVKADESAILPENEKNIKTRHYYGVRVHDGKAEEFDVDFDDASQTFTMSIDKFSTYTLGYYDTYNVQSVTLSKNTLNFTTRNACEILTATVIPTNAKQTVMWTSDNEAVATVDNNGKVTALANGTAIITATTTEGNKTASCTVTVNIPKEPEPQPEPSQQETQAMYRLYNPNSGEHFYTAVIGEKDHLVDVGWNYEGIAWYAPKSGDPVYRLYNPNAGDHHYTTNKAERDHLVDVGWNDEGIAWYSGGNTPLYRAYNPNAVTGSHHYTTSKNEIDYIVSVGWNDEGIGWYGVK